ncbi:MAG TPA: hypothetical protein VGM91_04995 [Conexibacter sp.]|jgi:hypothetical protein
MGLLDDAIREHLELKRRRGADPAEVARAEQEALGPVRRDREPAPAAPEDHPDEAVADRGAAASEQDEQTRVLFPDDHEAEPIRPADPALAPDDEPLPPMPGSVPGTTAQDLPAEPDPPVDRLRERDLADVDADDRIAPPRDERTGDDDRARNDDRVRDDDHGHDDDPPRRDDAPPSASAPASAPSDLSDHEGDILDQPTTEYRIEGLEHDDEAAAPPRRSDDDVLGATPEFLQETPEHDRLWFEQRPPRDFDFDD